MTSAGAQLFRCIQFEFPWQLGPEPGRYVVREPHAEEASHVLVIATLGAPERRRLAKRRARAVAADVGSQPAAVATTRATVIPADALVDEAAARAWLATAQRDEHVDDELDRALAVLARAVHAHRLATADPGVPEPRREQALVVRLGYGSGDQVADGRHTEMVELPPPSPNRQRRVHALRPQERLAAVLGGRQQLLACEELTLRARADLDAGRARQAALQLRVAFEAALAELDGSVAAARLAELRTRREAVGAAANAALTGELDAVTAAELSDTLERVEAALRARSAGTERAGD
ncbi:MAG: hypothetical protein DLM63_05540 [Solirubrobacterales bacterium]|nr:MAG: hypothetical protein DLM63_05540 [Solirubrobacterales bacterium]